MWPNGTDQEQVFWKDCGQNWGTEKCELERREWGKSIRSDSENSKDTGVAGRIEYGALKESHHDWRMCSDLCFKNSLASMCRTMTCGQLAFCQRNDHPWQELLFLLNTFTLPFQLCELKHAGPPNMTFLWPCYSSVLIYTTLVLFLVKEGKEKTYK